MIVLIFHCLKPFNHLSKASSAPRAGHEDFLLSSTGRSLFFSRNPGPCESCVNPDWGFSSRIPHVAPDPQTSPWDCYCFYQRKAGCHSLPKIVEKLFPLQLFVYLRNLRGWTWHEIKQINDWCPSPNSFTTWIIFCRCLQKLWNNC